MKPNSPRIDPELIRQLDSARDDQLVQAVLMIQGPGKQSVLDEDEVHRFVDEMVTSARKASGVKESDINVMARVQSLSVAARPTFVRELLKSPRVASAMANIQSEGIAIEPIAPSKKASAGQRKKANGEQ